METLKFNANDINERIETFVQLSTDDDGKAKRQQEHPIHWEGLDNWLGEVYE